MWLCAIAFVDDLCLGSKMCSITCIAWAPLWTVFSHVVVCMSRIFFRYLWFMLLKYEGPRTVQYGWNFNPVAISFLENVPNIFLHWATIIKPAQFQEALLTPNMFSIPVWFYESFYQANIYRLCWRFVESFKSHLKQLVFPHKFIHILWSSVFIHCRSYYSLLYKACPSESETEVGAPLLVELCDFSGRWQCMSGELWYTLDSGSVLLTETEAR